MKRLLLICALFGALVSTSCKKDADAAPEKTENLPFNMQGGPKKDMGDYD
ncbi:hypothetical protein Pedsa_1237 [Pseudopedobacter saltans DSM 12145]|uniref:Uncharacterized protein n=1 Tax=Pseudopedobacter saltans (strain ATCC 51119 / DSM 12145 / JCM 21818 / CCUG 39354 / LMG 10337 / NBRC 100064 / NCIMB 13643) TaxID=762903 RepID=F0SD48_PSESL|nr:hypothetical protein [Pseudopedobacter saltans]ADY51805.1 hypothetical protein Pedsa_1237 [Pseudopedobacter saltans DSM 12145]